MEYLLGADLPASGNEREVSATRPADNWQRRALDAEAKLAALQHVLGRTPPTSVVREAGGGQRTVLAEGRPARTDRGDLEVNPFLDEDQAAAGYARRDAAGLPPGGGGGAADLRRQRISTAESIQGVSAEVADVARASGIVANRIAGEMANERAARERSRLRRDTVASTSGSTGGPVPVAGPGSGPGRSVAAPARTQSGAQVGKAVAPAKAAGRGRTSAG